MTPKTREANRLARRALLVVTGVVAGSLLLAGCVGAPTDDPTPSSTPSASATRTPTPTDTTAAAPRSDSEATSAAEAKLIQFVDLLNAILSEKGVSPERIDAVSVPPASTSVRETAKAIADQGYVITGGNTITVTDAYSGDLTVGGTTVPFGTVTLTTCYDSSTRTVNLPSGEAAPQPPDPRTVTTATVVYSPNDQSWLVSSLEDTGKAC